MPNWDRATYDNFLARRLAARTKLHSAEPQQNTSSPLVKTETRKVENPSRVSVSIGIYRSRILDSDNAWGGSKALVDCLVTVGLLPGDSPSDIDLNVQQIKVSRKAQEQTVIEIIS